MKTEQPRVSKEVVTKRAREAPGRLESVEEQTKRRRSSMMEALGNNFPKLARAGLLLTALQAAGCAWEKRQGVVRTEVPDVMDTPAHDGVPSERDMVRELEDMFSHPEDRARASFSLFSQKVVDETTYGVVMSALGRPLGRGREQYVEKTSYEGWESADLSSDLMRAYFEEGMPRGWMEHGRPMRVTYRTEERPVHYPGFSLKELEFAYCDHCRSDERPEIHFISPELVGERSPESVGIALRTAIHEMGHIVRPAGTEMVWRLVKQVQDPGRPKYPYIEKIVKGGEGRVALADAATEFHACLLEDAGTHPEGYVDSWDGFASRFSDHLMSERGASSEAARSASAYVVRMLRDERQPDGGYGDWKKRGERRAELASLITSDHAKRRVTRWANALSDPRLKMAVLRLLDGDEVARKDDLRAASRVIEEVDPAREAGDGDDHVQKALIVSEELRRALLHWNFSQIRACLRELERVWNGVPETRKRFLARSFLRLDQAYHKTPEKTDVRLAAHAARNEK